MGSLSKSYALILILIMAFSCLSLLVVKPASAQTIPTPSVPTFTVNYINSSYYVPDIPYPGYYVNNSTIEIIITNQPFVSYTDSSGYQVKLFYNIRFNVLSGDTYTRNGVSYTNYYGWSNPIYDYPRVASHGPYTVLTIHHQEQVWEVVEIPLHNCTVGFQVQAMIGFFEPSPYYPASFNFKEFVGETSDWSNTQTLNIPDTNSIPSSYLARTSTPTSVLISNILGWTISALIFIGFLCIAILLITLIAKKTDRKLLT
jgi:hypothetical protein